MILYTGGTFDLLHYGHMQFLRACKKISSKVVVSLLQVSLLPGR